MPIASKFIGAGKVKTGRALARFLISLIASHQVLGAIKSL